MIKTSHCEYIKVKPAIAKLKIPQFQLFWNSELHIFIDPSPRELNKNLIRKKNLKAEILERNISLINNLCNKVKTPLIFYIMSE
jgi:hypothetical protein